MFWYWISEEVIPLNERTTISMIWVSQGELLTLLISFGFKEIPNILTFLFSLQQDFSVLGTITVEFAREMGKVVVQVVMTLSLVQLILAILYPANVDTKSKAVPVLIDVMLPPVIQTEPALCLRFLVMMEILALMILALLWWDVDTSDEFVQIEILALKTLATL